MSAPPTSSVVQGAVGMGRSQHLGRVHLLIRHVLRFTDNAVRSVRWTDFIRDFRREED